MFLEIENGIPQGSAVSPILFKIMINYIFTCLDTCIQSALYTGDGAIWMRGRNAPYIMENRGRAITKVERWSGDSKCQKASHATWYLQINARLMANS